MLKNNYGYVFYILELLEYDELYRDYIEYYRIICI